MRVEAQVLSTRATLKIEDIAKMIDHSLLRPDITQAELIEGLRMAAQHQVATTCVRPYDIKIAKQELAGTGVLVSTALAFPHGASTTQVKVFEVEKAMDEGAKELDVVLAIGKLMSGDFDYVEQELRAVVEVAHARSAVVKVIFENCFLTSAQIVQACRICEAVGADYVKTSTGYGPGGAKLEDVTLMRKSCSPKVAVKAAGGIRTLDHLLQFRAAGAKMIGTRSTQVILEEAAKRAKEGTLREVTL
jgi:deoxyribose-phosphate aldolase